MAISNKKGLDDVEAYLFGWLETNQKSGQMVGNVSPVKINTMDLQLGNWNVRLFEDLNELRAAAASAYAFGGTTFIFEMGEAIRKKREKPDLRTNLMIPKFQHFKPVLDPVFDPAEQIEGLFKVALSQLWDEILSDLKLVEKTAAQIIADRLNRSREQVLSEAKRYLVGYENQETFQPVSGVPILKPGRDAKGLQENLRELEKLRREADILRAGAANSLGAYNPFEPQPFIDPEIYRQWLQIMERRARLTYDAAKKFPIIHWLRDIIDPDDDVELALSIFTRLAVTWNSAIIVEERIQNRPAATIQTVMNNPAQDLGNVLHSESIRGPWGYPLMVQEALHQLGKQEPSLAVTAVSEALEAADSNLLKELGVQAGLTTLLITLHAVLPPAAIVADVMIGAWPVFLAIEEYDKQSVEYNAILNPAESIVRPPSLYPILLATLEAVTSMIPGKAGFAAGIIPMFLPREVEE